MLRIFIAFFMILGLLGLTFAGLHSTSSVLPGTFPLGDFVFNGSLKIGNDVFACNTVKEGTTRYDSATNVLQLCDGTIWTDVGSSVSGLWSSSGNDIYFDTGYVAIGTAAPYPYSALSMVADGEPKDVLLASYSSASADAKSNYEMFRARGTEASPSSVIDTDAIGTLRWRAHDGTGFSYVAQIAVIINGTPGTGDLPTRMHFSTVQDGTTSLTTKMVILENGYIGIGTTTPNDAVDVVGDIDATGCFQTDDAGTIGGTCLSDIRLKENIVSLNNSLDKIIQLRPVSFDWKKDSYNISREEGRSIGLIAQELEQVFPELVKTQDDGYKRIRYDIELKIHLIETIKEQQEQIKELKEIICTDHLQSEICQ